VNRKGIELAASFIVILIISLVMFGLATGITYKLFCASGEKIEQLDAATEKQIEQRLNSGALVQIPDATKTSQRSAGFCGGSTAASASFVLGIRNVYPAEQSFTVTCESKGRIVGDELYTPSEELCDYLQMPDAFPVAAKGTTSRLLVLTIPQESTLEEGKYMLTIIVDNPDPSTTQPYGAQNIYFTLE
jgi:hypothetical protein